MDEDNAGSQPERQSSAEDEEMQRATTDDAASSRGSDKTVTPRPRSPRARWADVVEPESDDLLGSRHGSDAAGDLLDFSGAPSRDGSDLGGVRGPLPDRAEAGDHVDACSEASTTASGNGARIKEVAEEGNATKEICGEEWSLAAG